MPLKQDTKLANKRLVLRGKVMFLNNQKSKEKEAQLLKRFLSCLDDIDCYLDQYDEFFGLAFNKDKPIESTENLTRFLAERYYELIEDDI